jgi:type IV pilus assembly protein PilQ
VPVLGHLFKTTSKVDNKDELLIFITPKILREGVNVY